MAFRPESAQLPNFLHASPPVNSPLCVAAALRISVAARGALGRLRGRGKSGGRATALQRFCSTRGRWVEVWRVDKFEGSLFDVKQTRNYRRKGTRPDRSTDGVSRTAPIPAGPKRRACRKYCANDSSRSAR